MRQHIADRYMCLLYMYNGRLNAKFKVEGTERLYYVERKELTSCFNDSMTIKWPAQHDVLMTMC